MDNSTNFKYEILQEDCEIEASEAESEIITISPNDPEEREHNNNNVLNSEINNITTTTAPRDRNPSSSSSSTAVYHRLLTNNNAPSSSLSLPPPPPYDGAEGPHYNPNNTAGAAAPPYEEAAATASTTCLLAAGTEDIPEDDLMTVLIVSNYLCLNEANNNNNPLKVSQNGASAPNGLLGPGLPSYDVATDLPSYEEAERSKEEEEENRRAEILDSQQDERNHVDTTDQLTSMAIGTDWTFLYTFIISFLFNWIGFLLSLCITSTVSGRCGALSGLGLSVVKWVAIVRHSNWASGFAEEESWLWWSLMVCGFLLFIRGCVQYIHIKYEWKKIAGRLQRFYFF